MPNFGFAGPGGGGGGSGTDADAIHDNVAGEISAVAEKVSPIAADHILIEDSAAADAKARIQIGNLPFGAGDVTGPGPTVTDRALALFNGTGGLTVSEGTWTNPAGSGDLVPDGDNTRDIGSGANRVAELRSRLVTGISGTGTFTPFAGIGGGAFVQFAGTGGTTTARFGGGNYTPPLMGVRVLANAAGAVATANHYSGGGVMFGSLYSGAGNSTSLMQSSISAYGNFTGGYLFPGSTSICNILNNASGAFIWAYVSKTGAGTSQVVATGTGAFIHGNVAGTGTHSLSAAGAGSFVQGIASGGGSSTIQSLAAGTGAFVQGRANAGGIITGSGQGAFAHGNATAAGSVITASGNGSFAVGHAAAATSIIASATNAAQFGQGSNSLANSLQVGDGGIRFRGSAFAGPGVQNGEMWVTAGGDVFIRSGGVDRDISTV